MLLSRPAKYLFAMGTLCLIMAATLFVVAVEDSDNGPASIMGTICGILAGSVLWG